MLVLIAHVVSFNAIIFEGVEAWIAAFVAGCQNVGSRLLSVKNHHAMGGHPGHINRRCRFE